LAPKTFYHPKQDSSVRSLRVWLIESNLFATSFEKKFSTFSGQTHFVQVSLDPEQKKILAGDP
jgi:hypothetical protein